MESPEENLTGRVGDESDGEEPEWRVGNESDKEEAPRQDRSSLGNGITSTLGDERQATERSWSGESETRDDRRRGATAGKSEAICTDETYRGEASQAPIPDSRLRQRLTLLFYFILVITIRFRIPIPVPVLGPSRMEPEPKLDVTEASRSVELSSDRPEFLFELCRDLYDPIEGDSAKPKDKDDKAWERTNRRTIGLIQQWIDNSSNHHVAQETNAKALWDKLINLYARKTLQNKAFLVKKLIHLRYQNGGDMAVHMSNFQDIVNRLTNLEIILPNELQACLLLGTLLDNWDTLVVALSNSVPNGKLSLATMTDSLFNEKTRKKSSGIFIRSDALITEQRGRSQSKNSSSKHDTGTSFRVTPHRDLFSSYSIGDYGYVKMGNEQSCKIVGIGDICLETELSCKLLLKKVKHISEIHLNLISTSQLDNEGYSNEFSNGRWKLSKGSLIVAWGQKTDTLYRLRARHNSGQVNVAENYPIEIWHRRLGHISEK
ncbi:hypothetical protein CRG98_030569, partial [Punica granatum]